jgi:hypothetical protein
MDQSAAAATRQEPMSLPLRGSQFLRLTRTKNVRTASSALA